MHAADEPTKEEWVEWELFVKDSTGESESYPLDVPLPEHIKFKNGWRKLRSFRAPAPRISAIVAPFPIRPEQKPAETLTDFDSRTNAWLAECRKEHGPRFQAQAQEEATKMGFRFVFVEFKDHFNTLVISYPQELDSSKLQQFTSWVAVKLSHLGLEYRIAPFPYK